MDCKSIFGGDALVVGSVGPVVVLGSITLGCEFKVWVPLVVLTSARATSDESVHFFIDVERDGGPNVSSKPCPGPYGSIERDLGIKKKL